MIDGEQMLSPLGAGLDQQVLDGQQRGPDSLVSLESRQGSIQSAAGLAVAYTPPGQASLEASSEPGRQATETEATEVESPDASDPVAAPDTEDALLAAFEQTKPTRSSTPKPARESADDPTAVLSPKAAAAAQRKAQREQARQEKQKGNRVMRFWVTYDGGAFSASMSTRKFISLPDSDKLVLAVGLARSSKFTSIYETEEQRYGYVQQLVNKGKEKGTEGYVDNTKLDELIDEAIEEGVLAKDDGGPCLTPEGIDYIQAQKIKNHWWYEK